MAAISLRGVHKTYGTGPKAVGVIHGVDVEIGDGEFVVIVGPSGCGKSTLLRMVAGLEEITGGEVHIGGRVVNQLEPSERDIAMVFQNYALYPHMSVYDNMAYGLKIAKLPKDQIEQRVQKAAKILELSALLQRKPRQLSGGQRQRVAMGRAIVRQPKCFLMDEPLSNLDAKLRVQMRAEISSLQHRLGITTVYVTHDQVEAMTMGDRVAVMSRGILQQVASPQELYDNPANLFVAGFIGSPQMNLVQGTFNRNGDGTGTLGVGSQTLTVPGHILTERPALAGYDGQLIGIGIRPESLEDATVQPGDDILRGEVEVHEGLGSEIILHIKNDAPSAVDEALRSESASGRLVARISPRSKLRIGDTASFSVDTSALHMFDLATGAAIRS